MPVSEEVPHFTTGAPAVLNSDGELTIVLPIGNIGSGTATNVLLTDITLTTAPRVSPAGLPLRLGSLFPTKSLTVSSRFVSGGLVVGARYLLTIRGTYETAVATYGFSVNRPVVAPAPAPPPFALLKAHVTVALAQSTWTYTLFNDEPLTSQRFIAAFSLDVVAPVTVIGVPSGWKVDTDNTTYVYWSAADQQMPYPGHIAPGGSLTGFKIQSARLTSEATPYIIASWNHQTDHAARVSGDVVLSPSATH